MDIKQKGDQAFLIPFLQLTSYHVIHPRCKQFLHVEKYRVR